MHGGCIIDLLRHGDTGVNGFYGSLDVPLNEKGWQQMRRAVMSEYGWQVIISSPLRRCAEFAKKLSQQTRLPLVLDSRLRELNFGDWEGRTAEQLMQQEADGLTLFWTDPWSYTPPNGERLIDLESRVQMAWQENCARYRGKRLLFITHGGVIRMLLYLARQVSRTQLPGIDVPHASLHTLTLNDSSMKCS